VLGAGGCAAPTLDAFEKARGEDLANIASLDPQAKAVALRERILRDGMQAKVPAFLNDMNMVADGPNPNLVNDMRYVYLWAPVREHVGEDYVALGDCLAGSGDVDGGIRAYEDAIAVADGYVLGGEAAAKIRLAALRGENKTWTARGEAVRAAAAKAMAEAEDRWLSSPEATSARTEYLSLLDQSKSAMAAQVAQQNAAALASLQSGLSQMQQQLATMPGAKGQAPNANASASAAAGMTVRMTQMIATGTRIATTIAQQANALRAGGDLSALRGIVGQLPGMLDAFDAGHIEAFLGSDTGQKVAMRFTEALVGLRRGDTMDRVMGTVHQAAELAKSLAPPPAPPAPPPPPAPTASAPAPVKDLATKLRELDNLHQQKLISDDEYARERARLLKEGL